MPESAFMATIGLNKLIAMNEISDLTKRQQRTVNRLANEKKVSVDRITGLVNSIRRDFYETNPDATGVDWSYGTTTINGAVPPGRLLPLQNTVEVVDKIVGDQHISVMLGTRRAGTRVGIHVHESGGTTFVVGGKVASLILLKAFLILLILLALTIICLQIFRCQQPIFPISTCA